MNKANWWLIAVAGYLYITRLSSVFSCTSSTTVTSGGSDTSARVLAAPSVSDRRRRPPGMDNNNQPPNQQITPKPPAAASNSTCGHSYMYHSADNPGAGIVGGVITDPGQYPWIVRLSIANEYLCGGSIIGDSWIITAAHCAKLASAPSDVIVFVADWDRFSTQDGDYNLTVSRIFIHSNYSANTSDYDFALLKLSTALNFSANWNTQKICLPSSYSDGCAAGTTAYIAGWGITRDSQYANPSRYLRSAYVSIANQIMCNAEYDYTITDRMICAGYRTGGVDTCSGDSGGPLMTNENGFFKLCGVTSFGDGCGSRSHFGVYARVGSVLEWIKSTMNFN